MTDFFSEATAGFLKPIASYLQDEGVSEVMVNGHDQIFVEKKGKLFKTKAQFDSEDDLLAAVRRIAQAVGRSIDEKEPIMDGRLADGSRVNAVIPPAAKKGIYLTIRKFSKDKLGMDDLIRFGSLTPNMADFLKACVVARLNIIVSGGTGSGKTTLINVLSSFIPSHERTVTIEDAAELQFKQRNVVRLETKKPTPQSPGVVTIRDCVINALRMRPDRIIVGETRGEEVIDMLQAMNTGHDGSMTTIHANNARDGISRLENMIAMAGIEMPLKAVRSQISSAVNLIVQASRLQDGSRRMTSITEITGMEGDVISMQEVFRFQRVGLTPDNKIIGHFTATGVRSHFSERFRLWGYDLPPSIFEPTLAAE